LGQGDTAALYCSVVFSKGAITHGLDASNDTGLVAEEKAARMVYEGHTTVRTWRRVQQRQIRRNTEGIPAQTFPGSSAQIQSPVASAPPAVIERRVRACEERRAVHISGRRKRWGREAGVLAIPRPVSTPLSPGSRAARRVPPHFWFNRGGILNPKKFDGRQLRFSDASYVTIIESSQSSPPRSHSSSDVGTQKTAPEAKNYSPNRADAWNERNARSFSRDGR
jgi:hypothetical protein